MPRRPAGASARARVRGPLVALAALIPLAWPGPAQSAQDRLTEGLDFVVLVDVSRSMYSFDRSPHYLNDRPNGSDPERLRWEAARLMIDLMTAEDRILILPFNDRAPAAYRDPAGLEWLVPGPLPRQMNGTPAELSDLMSLVDSFAHDQNRVVPNTDIGGTAILDALAAAATIGRPGRPPAGRRPVAFLLTDGKEETRPVAPGTAEATLRAQIGPWAVGGPRSPVFAVGLGPEADEALLLRIASLTEGHYSPIASNRELIETFRRLIWDMKGCWIKTADMKAGDRTADTLDGILDLGVLGYVEAPAGAGPRDTAPPEVAPRFAFSAGEGGGPRPVVRDGGGRGGYRYWYFGPGSPDDRSPFQQFAGAGLVLTTSWDRPPRPHRLFFAKRTARPLLEVVEPSGSLPLARHQELPVRLNLVDNPYFLPDYFRILAVLTPQGDAAGSGEVLRQELAVEPGTRAFSGALRLDRMPRSGAPIDYYELRIEAVGLPAPSNSLADYRLELPRRTIAVDNAVTLEPVERFELTRSEPSRRLTIRTRAAAPGPLRLSWALEPPQADGGPIDAEGLIVRQVEPPRSIGDGAVTLQDGEAVLEVALNPARLPRPGIVYSDGLLTLSPGGEAAPLAIPIGLRLDLAKLATTPDRASLSARSGGASSPPIRLEVVDPGPLPLPEERIRVALEPRDSGPRFGPEELWIEEAAPGDTPAAGPNRQEIELQPGRSFRIAFRPRPDPAKHGRHRYGWTASAAGCDPSVGELLLDYEAPALRAPPGPVVVHVARGETRSVQIPLGLDGIAGDRREVAFVPALLERGRPVFEPGDEAAGPAPAIAVELPGPDSPTIVEAEGEGAPGRGRLDLALSVPAGLPYGRYALRGAAVAEGAREAPIELIVVVNALEVLAPSPGDRARWVPADRVTLLQFFDAELTQTIRVRTGLGDPLGEVAFDVAVPGPFTNDDYDSLRQLPRLVERRPVGDRGSEVELTFLFPGVSNADPFRPYRVHAFLDCPGLMVERVGVEFVVSFVDLRAAAAARRSAVVPGPAVTGR